MKYAIIQVSNGNYSVVAEGITAISSAKTQWHNLCAALWNESSVITACAMIVDENLDNVEGYRDFITHPEEEQAND